MANLYNNTDYSPFIEVFDYENNKNITIELDNTKTLKDNANKFYKLYNKGKTSKQKLTEMKETFAANLDYYKQVMYSIERAENTSELLEIKQTRTPIELFEKLLHEYNAELLDRKLWFINPHYEVKFGLKPRKLPAFLGKIPWLRNFFTTSCFYVFRFR